MRKAIAVINEPKECADCKLCKSGRYNNETVYSCVMTFDTITDLEGKLDNCPLIDALEFRGRMCQRCRFPDTVGGNDLEAICAACPVNEIA